MKRDKQGPKDKDFYNASINSYSKSGTDMVPSAKMVHMIELLKQWDASGDKTIVYSQCESHMMIACGRVLTDHHRDVHAQPGRTIVLTSRHSVSPVHREDEPGSAGENTARVPPARWTKGHPDQYQVRRRRSQPR
jgi:hypothetical protein